MSVVLASGSPRRKELLEMLGVKDLKIIPAQGEEKAPEGAGPGELVMALALAKANEVRKLCAPDDVIIAADTIVWFEERVYGKPHSRDDAVAMLTKVRFREMTAREIEAYVDTKEPMDKAGAYGAQGKGALFVESIDGDFFNVMGLPVCRLGKMLNEQGVGIL